MQDFDKFWLLVIEVWREGFAGLDVGLFQNAPEFSLIFDKVSNAHIRSRYLHKEIKESILSARDCKALLNAQQLKQNPHEC